MERKILLSQDEVAIDQVRSIDARMVFALEKARFLPLKPLRRLQECYGKLSRRAKDVENHPFQSFRTRVVMNDTW